MEENLSPSSTVSVFKDDPIIDAGQCKTLPSAVWAKMKKRDCPVLLPQAISSRALAGQHCADQLGRAGRQGQSDVPMPEGEDDVPAASRRPDDRYGIGH